jgi:hypothetical protein
MKEGYLPAAGIYATRKQSQFGNNFACEHMLRKENFEVQSIVLTIDFAKYNLIYIGVKRRLGFLQRHNDRDGNEAQ